MHRLKGQTVKGDCEDGICINWKDLKTYRAHFYLVGDEPVMARNSALKAD